MTSKKFFKKLLTTASVMGIITGGAKIVVAADVNVGGAAINSSILVGGGGSWGTGVGNTNDVINFDNAAGSVTFNQNNAVVQGIKTTTTGDATAITVPDNKVVTIGSIAGANTLSKVVVDGVNAVLNLSGTKIAANTNDYSKLGLVELSNGSTLNIQMIDHTTQTRFKVAKIYGTGTLNVTGNSGGGSQNIWFGYSVGENAAKATTALTINATAGDNDNGDIAFRAINSSAPVTLRANTNKGDIRVNETTKAGTLDLISGDGVAGGDVGGSVTLAQAVTSAGSINITTGSGGVANAAPSGSGGKVTFDNTVNAAGNINITEGTGGDGTAHNQGKAGNVYFNGDVTALNLHFTSDAVIMLDTDKNINSNITTNGNVGTLVVKGGNSRITGDIGGANALALLQFNGAGGNTLTLNGNVRNIETLAITAKGIVTINNNAKIGTVELHNPDSTFKFVADSVLTGSVVAINDGDGIIDASVNSAAVTDDIGATTENISNIEIGAVGGATTFTAQGNVYSKDVTLAHDDSKFVVGGAKDITISIADGIDGANANHGKLDVVGDHRVSIINAVGNANPLEVITLNNTGTGITFDDVVKTQTLRFDANHTAPVTFVGDTAIANQIVFTVDAQSIIFDANADLAGGIDFGGFDSIVKLTQADEIQHAGPIVNTGASGKGTLVFGNDQTLNADIGSAANTLKEVKAVGNTITLGAHNIFAKDITGGTLDLNNAHSHLTAIDGGKITSNIQFSSANTKFTIPNNTVHFTGNVIANGGAHGIFEVSGNRAFTGSIGTAGNNIDTLNLQTKSVYTFEHANVYANTINVENGSTLVVDAPIVNFGKISAVADLKLDLKKNTAVLINGAELTGDVRLGVTVSGNNAGSLDVRGGNFDLSSANTVTFDITEDGAPVTNRSFQVLKRSGGHITRGPLPTVENKTHPTIIWDYQNQDAFGDTGAIFLKSTYVPTVAASIAEKAKNPSLIPDISQIDLDSDKENIVLPQVVAATDLMGAVLAYAPEQAKEVAHRQKPKPGASTAATTAATGATKSVLGARINGVSPNVGASTPDVEVEGISSGDEASSTKLGAWAVAFGSRGVQQKNGDEQGYRSRVYGGSIGMDAALSEHAILGIALTYADVSITHRDLNEGDRTKAPTIIGSIYGLYDFGNNWFTKGVVSYGDSKITHKDQRPVANPTTVVSYVVATSKFHSKIITTEFGGGYRYVINDTYTFTPSLVMQYNNTDDGEYTETGVAAPQTIDKKAQHKWSGIIGGELAMRHVTGNKVIAPEVHAYIDHKFSGKNPKTVSRFSGSAESLVGKYESSKTAYNIGTGIKVSSGAVECGVGYDATIAKKYLGHQGSVKVRVNL